MAVSWALFIPGNLRAGWKTGANLNDACPTASYTGGNPSSAADLKRSIVDANGNLKQGLTTADDTNIKDSILLAK